MEYKGFRAAIEYSAEDQTFIGKVLGIDGIIVFCGNSIADLRRAFKASVDEHERRAAEKLREITSMWRVRVDVAEPTASPKHTIVAEQKETPKKKRKK